MLVQVVAVVCLVHGRFVEHVQQPVVGKVDARLQMHGWWGISEWIPDTSEQVEVVLHNFGVLSRLLPQTLNGCRYGFGHDTASLSGKLAAT
jgi:hypothetical protein